MLPVFLLMKRGLYHDEKQIPEFPAADTRLPDLRSRHLQLCRCGRYPCHRCCGHQRHPVPPVRRADGPEQCADQHSHHPVYLQAARTHLLPAQRLLHGALCYFHRLYTAAAAGLSGRPPAGHDLRRRGRRHRRCTDLHEQLQHRRSRLHHNGYQGPPPASGVRQPHLCGGTGRHLPLRRRVPRCGLHHLRYHVQFPCLHRHQQDDVRLHLLDAGHDHHR